MCPSVRKSNETIQTLRETPQLQLHPLHPIGSPGVHCLIHPSVPLPMSTSDIQCISSPFSLLLHLLLSSLSFTTQVTLCIAFRAHFLKQKR